MIYAVTATLLNFVRLFRKAHEENLKQAELEKKKAQKEAEMENAKGINLTKKGPKEWELFNVFLPEEFMVSDNLSSLPCALIVNIRWQSTKPPVLRKYFGFVEFKVWSAFLRLVNLKVQLMAQQGKQNGMPVQFLDSRLVADKSNNYTITPVSLVNCCDQESFSK